MATIQEMCNRFAERVHDPEKYQLSRGSLNVFVDRDTIYSYGFHFPIATVLRNDNRKPICVLLNGDTYSNSTTGHQSAMRSALNKHCTAPIIIIPFTALDAANIDMNSIVPIDVKKDSHEYTLRVGDKPPENAKHVRITDAYWGGKQDVSFSDAHGEWAKDNRGMSWPEYMETLPTVLASGNQEVRRRGDGRYEWHSVRHWLGDALFSARIRGQKKRVRWLSSFDRQEGRLYFLCQLPPCTANTIDDALEALKPDTVKLAESMGRTVTRQGDIFSIPMPGLSLSDLKSEGGRLCKRSDVNKPFALANRMQSMMNRMTQVIDIRYDTPNHLIYREGVRRSSFGNMPWGFRPAEIANRWRKSASDIERRNMIVDTSNHRRDKWQEIVQNRIDAEHDAAPDSIEISLLGTAHTATHVVTMPDGTQYVRGSMYHDPILMGEDRGRDHVRRKIGDGKTWHMVTKNTVPVAKQTNLERSRSI